MRIRVTGYFSLHLPVMNQRRTGKALRAFTKRILAWQLTSYVPRTWQISILEQELRRSVRAGRWNQPGDFPTTTAPCHRCNWHWLQGPIDRRCVRFCPPMVAPHEWGVINLWSNQRSVSRWLTERSLWGSYEARGKGLPGALRTLQRDALNSGDSLKWI